MVWRWTIVPDRHHRHCGKCLAMVCPSQARLYLGIARRSHRPVDYPDGSHRFFSSGRKLPVYMAPAVQPGAAMYLCFTQTCGIRPAVILDIVTNFCNPGTDLVSAVDEAVPAVDGPGAGRHNHDRSGTYDGAAYPPPLPYFPQQALAPPGNHFPCRPLSCLDKHHQP